MTFYESFGVMMSLLRVVGRRGEGVVRKGGEEGW